MNTLLSEFLKTQSNIIVCELLLLEPSQDLAVLLKSKISALTEKVAHFFKFELLGKHAHCSMRHVHSGHSAKIGAYFIAGEAMYIRLDFTIVNTMSAWCPLEDVVLV